MILFLTIGVVLGINLEKYFENDFDINNLIEELQPLDSQEEWDFYSSFKKMTHNIRDFITTLNKKFKIGKSEIMSEIETIQDESLEFIESVKQIGKRSVEAVGILFNAMKIEKVFSKLTDFREYIVNSKETSKFNELMKKEILEELEYLTEVASVEEIEEAFNLVFKEGIIEKSQKQKTLNLLKTKVKLREIRDLEKKDTGKKEL